MASRSRIRSSSLVLITLGITAFCTLLAKGNRQFIFAPMPNKNDDSKPTNNGVVIQALEEEETNIRVLFPRTLFEDHITLSPRSGPYNYPLPNSLIKQTTTDVINSTVVLTSDQDIKVISYSLMKATSDAFSVVPMKYLGREYFLALFSIMTSEKSFRGTVTISALDKKARIEIFLNSTVQFQNGIYYNSDILRYTLSPFESLQLRPKYTNITGSRVVANTSVTVTVGADCADVPEGVQYCDHLAEQLAPVEAWGVLYVLSPFPMRRSGYLFQIVAGRNNTTVSYNGSKSYMNMGDYLTVDIPSQNMTFVSADKPISIIQYVKGKNSDSMTNSDPSMIRVSPIEQYVKRTVFPVHEANRTSTLTNIDTVYLEVTSECKYLKNITVFQNYQPYYSDALRGIALRLKAALIPESLHVYHELSHINQT
ncbi:IgGFc-binding protein-like [Lytechinus variegatus]|uniref:IgGFc-binding protein-like n=1 Tax=Lytechinus variegatus TaxID=7654 RepID=UPI001BB12461|nr:IgGFc-binding protein-like [Lytechinus variegatus]